MKSPGIPIYSSRAVLADRLANIMQVSRAIRSEVALTICESSEMRIASRQLRGESLRTTKGSGARRQKSRECQAMRRERVAQTIAQVLCGRGYTAFVVMQPHDTATLQ